MVVEAPWGALPVAATADALVGLAVIAPADLFAADVERRTRRERTRRDVPLAARAADAVRAFLGGDPDPLRDRDRIGEAHVRQQDQELLAAIAEGEVVVARRAPQDGAEPFEGGVARSSPTQASSTRPA